MYVRALIFVHLPTLCSKPGEPKMIIKEGGVTSALGKQQRSSARLGRRLVKGYSDRFAAATRRSALWLCADIDRGLAVLKL
jgi:hypothetical protein